MAKRAFLICQNSAKIVVERFESISLVGNTQIVDVRDRELP